MRQYELERGMVPLLKASHWVLVALALGSPIAIFVNNDAGRSWMVLALVSLFPVALFGGGAVLCLKSVRRIPLMPICLDREGIWSCVLGKQDGMIPWGRIATVRERHWLQCLDLVDGDNRLLLRVEYQLKNFKELRKIIVDKVLILQSRNQEIHAFSRGRFHHVGYVLGLAFMLLLLPILISLSSLGLLACLCIALFVVGLEYMKTVWRLEIGSRELTLSYPLRQTRIALSQVDRVSLEDEFRRGYRLPEVRLHLRDRKRPIRISLDKDASRVYGALGRALGRFRKKPCPNPG